VSRIAESHVEELTLNWFEELGWSVLHGPDIAPDELASERASYSDVILRERLESAIDSLNPRLPTQAKEEALRKGLVADSPSLVLRNRTFHKMLTDGVTVEVAEDGAVRGEQVRLIDFADPEANDWLVVNQFTVVEGQHNRRPDIAIFVNGLPLAVIELKNPADENATIETARKQFETYKTEIPSLFSTNELLVISDGHEARLGTITSPREWFLPWKTIKGDKLAATTDLELETLIKGVFDKERFLELIRHFIAFEDWEDAVIKKVAAYHQFHATQRAIESVVEASKPEGKKQGGVVWHTQGAGKSLTMVFFAGELVLHPEMRNPTIVVITDRNDLDDQLFRTFARCNEVLRQNPVQATDRAHLRKLLSVASGGVVFSTIQKFFPEEKGDTYPCLTERDNVVVIADEAHRSQYDFIKGFAKHIRDALPNATFIGFTGTPIELSDRNTYAVFGNTISTYDILQAMEDKATVPIYYESRIAKLDLDEQEKPHIDEDLEEVTENEEIERVERMKSKWSALAEIVGTPKRLGLVIDDLLEHFDERQSAMDGKALIVCMSRRICVDLYEHIAKRRPEWTSDDDEQGAVKVVMSGSASDDAKWQQHIRNKQRRDRLAQRFKDPTDPLKIVIVRDMWLTGFDVPCLHTMYIDKPMKGHTLMQAIARVNRVFRDKPGGLIVDYIGLADALRKAMHNYTDGGGRGEIQYDQAQAVAIMLEKLEVCRGFFHGFDFTPYLKGSQEDKLRFAPFAEEHIVAQGEDGQVFIEAVAALSKAFALAVPQPEAIAARDEVAFFQHVKAALVKHTVTQQTSEEELSAAVRQIVDKAIAPDRVIDILEVVGIDKPDISILSDEFLAEVRGMEHRNLAVEVLRKLLEDEIKVRRRTNLIQSRSFSDMLEATIHKYKNRAIETLEVIEELIKLAKEMREAEQRGEKLGLTTEELAFYDALETNDSAVAVMGDKILSQLARDLADTVRKSAKIDWTMKESIRAEMRVLVKRTLRKYGYPPDKQQKATDIVIQQAELLGEEWVEQSA
jgi:type I restriction enzyme R subunit